MADQLRMLCRLMVLAALMRPACGQTSPGPGDLLQRATAKVLDTVSRLPRYLCTQTIDRVQLEPVGNPEGQSYEPARRKQLRMTTSDRLRLDVAVTAGHEMYSWVTEGRFDDRSLFDLVRSGALSTGAFASFLEVVFRDDSALFAYKGEVADAGRKLVEFEYDVPVETSHYYFSGGGQRVITGYSGSIFVDPVSAELVRMTVQTDSLPPETGACESRTTLTYSRVRLNDSDFLLPFRVQLHILNTDGVELENTTTYSSCHEFLGESSLSFDEPAAPGADAPAKRAAMEELPAGLPFTIATVQPVNSLTAAAGDKVAARLMEPLKGADGSVLAPKGAAVSARIVQIRRFYVPRTVARLLIKLETIEMGGKTIPLRAQSEFFPARPALMGAPRLEQRAFNATRDNSDPAVAVLQLGNLMHDQLPVFESKWRTVASKPGPR